VTPVAAGVRLGPYEVLGLLGAGGMGEVYRARDTRLGRDVAVKVLPTEYAQSPDRLRRFEQEARLAGSLSHPNVLSLYDVGTHEGAPYLVTELLEGRSLRDVLDWGPLGVRKAVEYAQQIARGLAAAHAKGIVHRDLKPENLFVTRDGQVKILDFGLAKLTEADASGFDKSTTTTEGRILGTTGYMSPEQVRGRPVDARSDIFALGAVLYEMLSGRRAFSGDTAADTMTAILTREPGEISGPGLSVPPGFERMVRQCLEKEPEERFQTAHDLALALETMVRAPAGGVWPAEAEERSPYPGLLSFTEQDAGVFFGREAEVRALWERLRSRKLLAVIGASGSGKTSFLRAGVIPARPEGWAAVCATPGSSPALGLARALAPELTGDAIAEMLAGVTEQIHKGEGGRLLAAVRRWRAQHAAVLIILDQFEELFTLCPKETQERFAALVGRLVSDADVHVVLSMRDDFLMRCSEQEALEPVFESLTPLPALTAEALRRAVVEPAGKRGYRLEDGLVEEMLSAVEGVRGALPLLAFAVARLWEKRDREQRLLSRAAYEEIGGVAGALGQHAEATMERIGNERPGIVREIFRNLVTAQGTRAVIDREELLSAFTDKAAAGEVLGQLIDARLLTSYEVSHSEGELRMTPGESGGAPAGPGEASHHRIEVVHESLLSAWPRLVRWRAQDEEGAVLRDQLRQAARLWGEKGRTSDLLWGGTAFQEYVLWRDRYAGALTALEEDFARAMAERAQRQRRLRRLVVGSIVAAALAVAAVTGALWRRSEAARERAGVEAQRAEAGKLLALGRTHLQDDPTAALAFARGSLDLFDTPEARRFALEALWRGPVARILPLDQAARQLQLPEDRVGTDSITISPDGRWLAAKSQAERRVLLFPDDGGTPRALPLPPDTARVAAFGPRSDLLITGGSGQTLRYWSLPDLREIRTVELGGLHTSWGGVRGEKLVVVTQRSQESVSQVLTLPDGNPRVIAVHPPGEGVWGVHPQGTQALVARGQTLGLRSLDGANRLRVLGRTRDEPFDIAYSPRGDLVASTDNSAETRIWSTAEGAKNPVRILQTPEHVGSLGTVFDPQGRRVSQGGANGTQVLWDLEEVPDARPLVVGRPGPSLYRAVTWDPAGRWLVTGGVARRTMEFWPVSSPRRRVLPGFATSWFLAFTPDGRWLAHCIVNKPVRLWPLSARDGTARDLVPPEPCVSLAMDPAEGRVLVGTSLGTNGSKVLLYPIPGGPARLLADRFFPFALSAFDPDGRQAVVVPLLPLGPITDPALRVLRVWDLPSGRERIHSVAHLTDAGWSGFGSVAFAPDGLYVGGQGGVRRLSLPAGPGDTVTSEMVYEAPVAQLGLSRARTHLLVLGARKASGVGTLFEEMLLLDLPGHTTRPITTHGARLSSGRLSPSGRVVVTGDHDGVVRVGPVTGEEPHLLLGHQGPVSALAISPDERWIASVSDESISIWPMPDVTKPPLHTLPHAELLAKLDALTNLRVVREPAPSTGWRLEIGSFPGWRTVPTW
jgi:WD40 repeat protein